MVFKNMRHLKKSAIPVLLAYAKTDYSFACLLYNDNTDPRPIILLLGEDWVHFTTVYLLPYPIIFQVILAVLNIK